MDSQPSLRVGLVSVTFRHLPAEEVARIAAEAELTVIEWGGDIHAPHGDTARARHLGRLSRELGLFTTYGSYYRVGVSEAMGLAFEAVLQSALALGASAVRVWAGDRGSAEADVSHWERVITDARHIIVEAAQAGVKVAFERHSGTLADTRASHLRLLSACAGVPAFTYWQPDPGQTVTENLASLREVMPWVLHAHVFHWTSPPIRRWPLVDGRSAWLEYLALLRASQRAHNCLLEFVPDDALANLLRDAAVLKNWLARTVTSAS